MDSRTLHFSFVSQTIANILNTIKYIHSLTSSLLTYVDTLPPLTFVSLISITFFPSTIPFPFFSINPMSRINLRGHNLRKHFGINHLIREKKNDSARRQKFVDKKLESFHNQFPIFRFHSGFRSDPFTIHLPIITSRSIIPVFFSVIKYI